MKVRQDKAVIENTLQLSTLVGVTEQQHSTLCIYVHYSPDDDHPHPEADRTYYEFIKTREITRREAHLGNLSECAWKYRFKLLMNGIIRNIPHCLSFVINLIDLSYFDYRCTYFGPSILLLVLVLVVILWRLCLSRA